MPESSFVMVGERHLKCQIQNVEWSPKRDLITMASTGGELLLYRLSSLERVWMLAPPASGILINSICWRPDGNVISVAYNKKESGVAFVEMEKSHVAWGLNDKTSLKSPITYVKWFESPEIKDFEFERKMSSLTMKDYIPQLPTLQSKDVKPIDAKLVLGDLRFNMLMCYNEEQYLIAYSYGMFPIFQIDLNSILKTKDVSVSDIFVFPDWKFLSVAANTSHKNTSSCFIQIFDLSKVLENILETNEASQNACQLLTTMSYMENVLELMNECCESVVQEMESKLTKFLVNKSMPGTIGDEFLQMLLWGKPSDLVEDLLVNCITGKGITKMGTLIEASYSSIQQLLVVNFLMAADMIYYILIELKGMCTPSLLSYMKIFNLKQIEDIIRIVGSTYLKAVELQQVIGQNLQKFKVFFQWLYFSVLMFKEEGAAHTSQMTQSQLEVVADVIMESFIHEHEQLKQAGRDRHFNLDKVSQYLQDAHLVAPQSSDNNEWHHLVDVTPCLAHNPLILQRQPGASLRQLFTQVKTNVSKLLHDTKMSLNSEHIEMQNTVTMELSGQKIKNCQWFDPTDNHLYSLQVMLDLSEIVMLRTSITERSIFGCCFYFTAAFVMKNDEEQSESSNETCTVSDVSAYNDSLITFVLNISKQHYLVQVSIPQLVAQLSDIGTNVDAATPTAMTSLPRCDVTSCVAEYCAIAPMTSSILTSSGARKVSCLVGSDLRHVRAYDMDQVNDDDDADVSMATNDE